MSRSHLFGGLLVLAHLLLSLAFSVVTPLGEAPDEADHWAYIVYLADTRALPEGPRITQSKHPPLYHISAAAVAALAMPDHGFLRANPDVELMPRPGWSPNFFIHTAREAWPWQDTGPRAFHLARVWSVLLSTLTVAATYGLMNTAFPGRMQLTLTVTGVLAFVPEFAFIGGAANNDSAAALFGTLALWSGFLFLHNGARMRPVWWAPLALGAGLLSKTSTLGIWPAVGVAIVFGACTSEGMPNGATTWWQALRQSWRRWAVTGLLVFGGALLLASPWGLRNWRLYGDPLGMSLALQTIDVRTTAWTWADTQWLLAGWFRSFWGKFGGAGQIPLPDWSYLLLLVLTVLSVTGLAGNCWPARRRYPLMPLLIIALAGGGVVTVMARYSLVALGTDQGRLLFPAIAPLIALWTMGLLWWVPERRAVWLQMALVGGMAVLACYALLGVVRPAFAPPAPPSPAEVRAAQVEAPIRFGPLALTGWSLDGVPVLYWQAHAAPAEDYRTVLRVVAEDGTLVWEWRRSPGAGRWSTDRWPAGTIVADAYVVRWPAWAGAGRYLVEVGVQPFDENLVTPAHHDGPFVPLGVIER